MHPLQFQQRTRPDEVEHTDEGLMHTSYWQCRLCGTFGQDTRRVY